MEGMRARPIGGNGIENRESEHELIERAFRQAEKTLARFALREDSPEFIRAYGADAVKRDHSLVAEAKQQFGEKTPEQEETKRLATIFEAIVLSECEEDAWFGGSTSVRKTSEFDDLLRHTDLVAQLPGSGGSRETIGLAVDVTFGSASLGKKFDRLQGDIERGRLQGLKYVHGAGAIVPRAIVGLGRASVLELAQLWVEEDMAALRAHPASRAILEEVWQQMDSISGFAAARGRRDIADAYARSRDAVKRILAEKHDIDARSLENDPVLSGIRKQVSSRFKTAGRA